MEYTKDNIPQMKPALSLQAQAAYLTAEAELKGETHTPKHTPIIGSVEVDVAKKALTNALGMDMDPQKVLKSFGTSKAEPAKTEVEEVTGVELPDETHDTEYVATDDEPPEMSITGMLDTIAATPSLPLAIVGDAGTGKTSIIRQWAKDNGYELNLFLANTASEDDVAGAITPDHEKKMAVAYPLEKLHRSTTHKTVLFLDELNTARREIQDPLLTLIQDRCLPNGTPLHPDTIIVTAINPSATYNNHEMSPQLRNRFMWYYHTPSEYDWLQWVLTSEEGKTPAGKHLEGMILDGTLKFDKDEAFTDERNEFTTPRSLYNLLKVARGSVTRLKAFADNLVAPATAEAIRLHGYNDKDSRANSFFDERKKVAQDDHHEPIVNSSTKDFLEKGLGLTSPNITTQTTSTSGSQAYKQEYDADVIKEQMASSLDALGGTAKDDASTESSLMDDIKKRLSNFETL